MVSEKKKRELQNTKTQMKEYPVIGIINMHKLPGRQLHEIRNKLRGEAVIRMVKKRIITKALAESDVKGVKQLADYVKGEPALLLSRTDPFKLARKIEKSKSKAQAKPGDISPEDILIKAGPTPLPPGPVIGELQKVKLPAGVQGDKIHIMKDTVIVKEGEEVSADVASIMAKLNIEPMEIGLNVVAAWEAGAVYPNETLFVPIEEYENQVRQASSAAFNLSISINLPTPETVPFLLAKASQEATSLATEAGLITPETIGPVLAKASAQAGALAGKVEKG
jgi:large subunit ribosomal protein L10